MIQRCAVRGRLKCPATSIPIPINGRGIIHFSAVPANEFKFETQLFFTGNDVQILNTIAARKLWQYPVSNIFRKKAAPVLKKLSP